MLVTIVLVIVVCALGLLVGVGGWDVGDGGGGGVDIELELELDDGGGGDGLASAGRALDEREGLLQDVLDRIHLGVVELGEAGSGEALGHRGAQALRLELMTEQLVVLREC